MPGLKYDNNDDSPDHDNRADNRRHDTGLTDGAGCGKVE
jgi:hypothetical protein